MIDCDAAGRESKSEIAAAETAAVINFVRYAIGSFPY
jgi:hypothetical protein